MSPIIDLQRRLVEVGRIRMGKKGDRGQPQKLDTWRLTSRDQERLEAVATLHGGSVRPWSERDGEFEVITTSAELPIMLLPGQTLSQWHELWSGGGCQRRCDGQREILSDSPCLCDQEPGDRKCKPTTRLSVMLPDIPGLGCWRLESHGYYAAVELAATAHMLEQATARGQLLPARLRIDQRRQVKDGRTTRYAVPVIDIDITMREALPLASQPPQLAPGHVPVARLNPGVTVDEGLAGAAASAAPRAAGARAAAPIPVADLAETEFSTGPVPVPDEGAVPPVVFATDPQRRLMFATAKEHGLDEAALKAIILKHTGQLSSAQIPRDRFDRILKEIEATPEHPADAPTVAAPSTGGAAQAQAPGDVTGGQQADDPAPQSTPPAGSSAPGDEEPAVGGGEQTSFEIPERAIDEAAATVVPKGSTVKGMPLSAVAATADGERWLEWAAKRADGYWSASFRAALLLFIEHRAPEVWKRLNEEVAA